MKEQSAPESQEVDDDDDDEESTAIRDLQALQASLKQQANSILEFIRSSTPPPPKDMTVEIPETELLKKLQKLK